MRLRDLYNRSLTFRLSVFMTIIAIIFYILGTLFINNTVERIRLKRATLDSKQNIQLNFEEVLAFYAREYSQLRKQLNTVIPPKNNIVPIIEKIEADSTALGVTVKVNNIEVAEAENVVPFVRYRLSFESNNKQLLSIVDILNNLPVYVEVQNITSIAIETVEFPILAKHEIIFDIFVRN